MGEGTSRNHADMPNSAPCTGACLCADLYVHSQLWEQTGSRDDRQLSIVIGIQDTPIDYLWLRAIRDRRRVEHRSAGSVFLAAVLRGSGLGVAVHGPVLCGRILAVLGAVQEYGGDERRGFLDADLVLGG